MMAIRAIALGGPAQTSPTFREVLAAFWRARIFIASGMAVGGVIAALFLFLAVPATRAWMLVAPASPMNGGNVSALLADERFSALSALAERVSVPNSSDFVRFENILTGPAVAGELLKDPKILQGLSQDRAFIVSRPRDGWTPEALAGYLTRRVRIEPVGATALRRLVYLHPNQAFAAYFLHNLHRAADGLIRRRLKADTVERIAYLQDASARTGNPDHQRALTALLLEQERVQMLVSADTPYAASVVEPPTFETRPAWPSAMLVVASFLFAGALAAQALFSALHGRKGVPVSHFPGHRAQGRSANAPFLSARDAAE